MDQDLEIRFGLKWEEWQPKIIQYANINTIGKSIASTTANLLAASKMEIPTGNYLSNVLCNSYTYIHRSDGSI